jgi:predicted Zn-dependent protease
MRTINHSLTQSTRALSLVIVGHPICAMAGAVHRTLEGEAKDFGAKGAVARGYFRGNTRLGYSNADDNTYYWHTVRLIQHELAHNYGAEHCNAACLMNGYWYWDLHEDWNDIWCITCINKMQQYRNEF